MAFIVDEETGNITLVQGDSGEYIVEDVPCDKNYKIYFSIYDSKRRAIGFEIYENIYRGGGDTPVFDNDLYCWSYSSNCLYSLSTAVNAGDTLYNNNNEPTENTVTSINSIVYNDSTYDRDTSNNINEYTTTLYAWGSYENFVYTDNPTPYVSDPSINKKIYNSSGEETGYTVTEYELMQGWTSEEDNTVYTLHAAIVGDNVYNKYGEKVVFHTLGYEPVYYTIQQIHAGYITIGVSGLGVEIRYNIDEENTIEYIVESDSSSSIKTRNEADDIKTIVSVIAYAWNNSSEIIYTIAENPTTDNTLYDYDLTPIGNVASVASFLVTADEYLRNSANDIIPTQPEGDDIPTTNVTFKIPPALTNYLTVKKNEEFAEYYFGIKLCSEANDYEDTLLLGNSELGDLNTITVYPKKVEGTING